MLGKSEHQHAAAEDCVRDWLPLLFLIDVALMFLGIFVAVAAAWWVWLTFHIAAFTYVIFVLRLAHIASRYIPRSIPFQRQLGILLYLSCHTVKLLRPDQIPIALVGYVLFAGPISLLFLFDHLLDEQDDKQQQDNNAMNRCGDWRRDRSHCFRILPERLEP